MAPQVPPPTASLAEVAAYMAAPGRGILASDESTGTIGKRLEKVGLQNDEVGHLYLRMLLLPHLKSLSPQRRTMRAYRNFFISYVLFFTISAPVSRWPRRTSCLRPHCCCNDVHRTLGAHIVSCCTLRILGKQVSAGRSCSTRLCISLRLMAPGSWMCWQRKGCLQGSRWMRWVPPAAACLSRCSPPLCSCT